MNSESSVIDPALAGMSDQAGRSRWFGWSDMAGMVASIACAIHCAAMPFVIAYLPALGLSFLADEAFHKWMAVGCLAIALTAFVPGLRKHGRLTPVIIGSVGLVMISTAAFGFAGDCCVACESDSQSYGLAVSDQSGGEEPLGTSAGCTDECCSHCADENSLVGSDGDSIAESAGAALPSPPPASSQLGARIAPWLTPFGGLVLVAAHLLNRRYGCLCGCCENESVTEMA